VTIEATFEALLRLVGDLNQEEQRAMREGLDEQTLVLFALLKKPELEKKEIDRIKKVAAALFALLQRKKAEIYDWRAREQPRDDMRRAIGDFLYDDATGLPERYADDEIEAKTDAVFQHAYRVYA